MLETDFNIRLRNIISKIRDDPNRQHIYPPLIVVKEEHGDPQLKMVFLQYLLEDRSEIGSSYSQFLIELREKIKK